MDKDNNRVQGKLRILITILLPIFAIMVPIALYMFQLKDKKLTYEVVSYSLINLSSTIQDEIEIRFLGEKVTDLSAMNIEIKNSGDMPIRKEDFERNMIIDFGKDAEILKTSISYKFPSNLTPILSDQGNSMQILPLLLNPGDHFTIETIVSKTSSDPRFDARIAGIKTPTKISPKEYSGSFLSSRLLVFIICAFLVFYSFSAVLFLVSLRPTVRKQEFIQYKPIALVTLLSAICSSYLTVKYRIVDFTSFLSLEILLYLSVIILGVLLGCSATKKFKTSQKNGNDFDGCVDAQQSD